MQQYCGSYVHIVVDSSYTLMWMMSTHYCGQYLHTCLWTFTKHSHQLHRLIFKTVVKPSLEAIQDN